MLRAVGNPVAVNPDPALAEIAKRGGLADDALRAARPPTCGPRNHLGGHRRRIRRLAHRGAAKDRPPAPWHPSHSASHLDFRDGRRPRSQAPCPELARGVLLIPARARGGVLDALGSADRTSVHGGGCRRRGRGANRLPGRVSLHPRSYPTMYRGRLWTMRQFAGFGTVEADERALPVSARPGPDRPLDRLRYPDAHGLRLRPPPQPRRGRSRAASPSTPRRHGASSTASRSTRSRRR